MQHGLHLTPLRTRRKQKIDRDGRKWNKRCNERRCHQHGRKKQMKKSYKYGKSIASISQADGISGILIRGIEGKYCFRVRVQDDEFIDYDLRHFDLSITIHDSDAAFYKIGDRHVLDHAPETLGLKVAETSEKTEGWYHLFRMFAKILKQIREKVRNLDYVVTLHADEAMDDDGLNIFDVEEIIFTGEIFERQQDHETDEWKYLIRGQTLMEEWAIAVVKISITSRLVVITVYVE